jgi:hypothetical protein
MGVQMRWLWFASMLTCACGGSSAPPTASAGLHWFHPCGPICVSDPPVSCDHTAGEACDAAGQTCGGNCPALVCEASDPRDAGTVCPDLAGGVTPEASHLGK